MNKPLTRIREKLKRFFTDIRLREKMLLFYLIGGVLPLVMADIYMYSSVRNVMLEQEKQAAEDELSIIADSVGECIAVIEDISKRLYFNESIEHIAFTTYKSYEEILADYRNCDTITDFTRHYYQEISGITIYTYNPTISNNEYFIYADENLREQADYVETVSRAGAPYWSYEFDRMTGKYNLRLSRVLYTADMERVGIVSIEMQNKRSELPVTIDESVTCAALREQNLGVGWGIGISTSCKDPVRAVQFLDWMCTEEAQVLLNWGIENVNYFYDKNGVRYRTEEEIIEAGTNPNYAEETGVGRHNYPFPSYGNMALDSTGNHYTTNSREEIAAGYNEAQLAALKAWKVDMLIDIFPQKEVFGKKYYSPIWAKVLPSDIKNRCAELDAVAWPGLIDCIVCPPDRFEEQWDKLQADLVEAGLYEADAEMTGLIRQEVEFRKELENK